MKLCVTSLLMVVFALAVSCTAAAQDTPVKAESRTMAVAFWQSQLTPCADSYAQKRGNSLYQILGAKFVAQGMEASSEAERLNGLEWQGKFFVFGSSVREILPGPPASVSDWKDISKTARPADVWAVEAKRVRGVWWVATGSEFRPFNGWYQKMEPLEGATFNGGAQLHSGGKVDCASLPPK